MDIDTHFFSADQRRIGIHAEFDQRHQSGEWSLAERWRAPLSGHKQSGFGVESGMAGFYIPKAGTN